MIRLKVVIEHTGENFPPPDWDLRVQRSLVALAERMQERFEEYPPETIANMSNNPSGRWWERGLGWVYRSGRVNPISEHLGDRWIVQMERMNQVNLANQASYSTVVHATKQQAGPLKRIGWPTGQEVFEMLLNSKEIEMILEEHLLEGLNG